MAKQTPKAVAVSTDGLTTTCKARKFEIIMDEPKNAGGNDAGMNPVEVLLSALAACKTIVIRSFADKFRMNINSLRVEVEGVIDPEGFMGKNKDAKIGLSEITVHYYIDADNSDKEIARFIDFVESHCPVRDTLVNSPEVKSEIHS